MDLIQKKLTKDLKEHFKEYDIDDIITKKVKNKLPEINMSISSKNHYRDDNKSIEDSKRCQARLWNDHCEGRCKNRCKKDGLCLRHYNMSERGDLELGRVSEEKPLRNKNGKVLSWYENIGSVEDHINLLREENKKRILQYIIHQTSNTEKS